MNGTKRIELRLYDEKRQQISIGDIIEFYKDDDNKFQTKVIGLLRYDSFENLVNDFDISILSDKSTTKSELLSVLGEFYTAERQKTYGVVGIRIELI